jgi:hypothetical protein
VFEQGDRGLPRTLAAFAVFLIVGTIVSVSWLGLLGFAVGAFTALLYLMGHALGAGNFWWGATDGTDKRDALRAQLAKPRWTPSDAEDFDEDAWERARRRRGLG